MKKYDYVIILCASTLKNGQFDDLSSDGSYLGGNIRMQAVVELKDKVNKFIVVGGGIEENGKDRWRKTNDMYKYLKKNGVSPQKIIRVASVKDTHGNLRAIYKCLKEKLNKKKLGILTNFYHIPRTLRFATDIFNDQKCTFIPIAAESVVNDFPFKYWPQLIFRIHNEIKGLSDWENGVYKNQKTPSNEWQGEVYRGDIKKL